MMERTLIYEGKAKRIYSLDGDSDNVVQEFKDDATAFNGVKKDKIKMKGIVNNNVTSAIFTYLNDKGIPTHFVKKLSENEMLVKKVDIIKVEVVCRNIAAGSLVKKFGLTEGQKLNKPLIEYYYKSDELGDPLFSRNHIYELGLANESDMETIDKLTFEINKILSSYFTERKIKLVDFKLEFGKDKNGNIILADEISPDTCRLWDSETNKKMDKDRFRFDLGEVEESYKEVLNRVTS